MFGLKQKKLVGSLINEKEQLKNQVMELQTALANTTDENQQILGDMSQKTEQCLYLTELNKLRLSSSVSVDNIRYGMTGSATTLVQHRDTFQPSQQLFDQIINMFFATIQSSKKLRLVLKKRLSLPLTLKRHRWN